MLLRFLLVPIGLMLAIPTGAVFLMIGSILEPSARGLLGDLSLSGMLALMVDLAEGESLEAAGALVFGAILLLSMLLIAPIVCVALAGELLRLRSYVWYAGMCGLLTAAVPWLLRAGRSGELPGVPTDPAQVAELRITLLLFLTGVASGFVYWLIAGRGAGPRETAPARR